MVVTGKEGDNGVVEYQFYSPHNRTKWQSFQRAIYDKSSNQICGRSPKNWGLRSVDSYERLVIEKLGIAAYGMEDVENHGISRVADMALGKIDPERKRSIHVSFDIDSLDTLEAPSTGTSVRGGLTLREGIHLMELIYSTGRLGAMDLVEVNPEIGSKEDVTRTVNAAIHVILAACGHNRKGLLPVDELPLQTFPPTRDVIK